jgi:hypothetical protein
MNLSKLDKNKKQKFLQAVDAYTGIGLLTANRIFSDPPKCTVSAFLIKNAFVKNAEITELVNWIESDSDLPMPTYGSKVEINLTEEEITEALLACVIAKLGIKKEKILSAGIDFKDVFGSYVPFIETASVSIELDDDNEE